MGSKILLKPLIFLESIIDRIVSVIGAIVFIQIPTFIVQYQQRLGGHVDELARLVKQYKSAASVNGRTVEEYIGLHLNYDVKEFVSTGKLMTDNMERFNELSLALQNLSESSGIKKFFVFLKSMDFDIFKGTYKDFVPGISFNLDSILYCIVGIIFSMLLYLLIKKSLQFFIIKNKETKRFKV
ncbi:MAG: DUF2937 family protein [Spirochaetes bacterium]|nr:DUF2937 family protein [Spirochaetota bacterium]